MSSLKDLASLIMIPSLYKDGELHTVKPLADENIIVHPDATDNNDGVDGTTPSTSSNFTFSRGSNLAATRVDVNGLIEKGRENLLLQSNQFDTTWTTSSASVTSGQSGYDGSSDAWLLSKTGAGGRVQQSSLTTSAVTTFSVYAKAGTKNWLATAHPTSGAYFNLSNGTTGNTIGSNIIESKIEDVGNGWYKCIVVHNSSATNMQIYVADSNGNVNETSGSIYIQDAQLEQGLVATDYIETGASTAQAGILEDMPRLDYSGGASCPSLLLEPQRTNIITNSEYFKSWNNNDILFDFGYAAPDGTNSAYKITKNGTQPYLYLTGISAENDSRSIYARTTSGTGQVHLTSHNSNSNSLFTITEEWKRFDVTSTPLIATNYYAVDFRGGNLDEVILWGAQLEQGSYPTSYIPTYGTSQTRSNDAASLTGVADLLGDANGTLFVEVEAFQDSSQISLSDGTLNNVFPFRFRTSNFQNDMKVGGVGQGNLVNSPTSLNTNYKVAISYANNYRAMYFDGTLIDEDLILNTYPSGTLTRLGFDRGDGVDNFYGRIKQILVFPTALTDSECIALTTL